VIVSGSDLLPIGAPATTLDFTLIYHDGGRDVTDRQHIDLDGYRSALVFDEGDGLSKIADRLEAIERKIPSKTIVFPGSKKACSYCGMQIPHSAKKCPNCLEWLSGSNRRTSAFRGTHARKRQGRDRLLLT
jgi:hypothetical protein